MDARWRRPGPMGTFAQGRGPRRLPSQKGVQVPVPEAETDVLAGLTCFL